MQVRYREWTSDGDLRAPVFKGLRPDVDPARRPARGCGREPPVDVIDDAVEEPRRAAGRAGRGVASCWSSWRSTTKADFTLDVDGTPIKLTNLDKEFWPATESHPPRTKRELIRYYARVAPYLLPHLATGR